MIDGTTIGQTPMSVSHTESLRMPQSTDVGQSGPAHRMHTLPRLSPGLERVKRIAFIMFELIEIIASTDV